MTFDEGWVMNVHRPFACPLLILIACGLFPKVATAEYTMSQCIGAVSGLMEAMKERAFKTQIYLERQILANCNQYFEGSDHTDHLGGLALALNSDNQHAEALSVANRCLEINAREFGCLVEKANALTALGRTSEAKSVVESSLSLPAITEFDLQHKEILRRLKLALSLKSHTSPPQPNQNRSSRANVPLKKDGGIFVVPVQINGAITLNFTIDSGAADVSVPADVYSTLKRTGTISDADITGERTYVLADGSKTRSVTFIIRSLRVGDHIVENVRASVTPAQGILLLGQSFLERFKSWSFDNTKHQLVLEPQ
jgi:clan AA aspartic protease (TIGR02281 family)